MSYAVFTMAKVNASLNSIGKHIERTAHPDNADPSRRQLNRNRLIEYPEGVGCLAEAVEHRIATAGLTRKVGPNQVRCITILMTSDNEAMQKIIRAGKLDQWIADSIGYCRDTFGAKNVVAASLHLDEYTPHLHVAVVPIVTTERKRKASEAKVKRRYRTKPGNRARLSCNDIMTQDNMTRFQDEYALAVKKYGLERGIRGSKARHRSQHEYYRQCQIDKLILEQDIFNLSDEKEKIDTEKKALEKERDKVERSTRVLEARKTAIEEYNAQTLKETSELTSENAQLLECHDILVPKVTNLIERHDELEKANAKLADDIARLEMQKMRKLQAVQDAELVKYKTDIERYLPDASDLLFWGRYCTSIGFPDSYVHRILSFEKIGFKGELYSHEHQQIFRTEGSWAKLERSADNKHTFELKIDGVSVFQWFKDMARKLLEKMGLRQPQPSKKHSHSL